VLPAYFGNCVEDDGWVLLELLFESLLMLLLEGLEVLLELGVLELFELELGLLELELLEPRLLELLPLALPEDEPLSAAVVCASRLPDTARPCSCWNCSSAALVFGPITPSIAPTSLPLSFRACWAWRTDSSACASCVGCELEAAELSFDAALVEPSFVGAAVVDSEVDDCVDGWDWVDAALVDEACEAGSLAKAEPAARSVIARASFFWVKVICVPFLWGWTAGAFALPFIYASDVPELIASSRAQPGRGLPLRKGFRARLTVELAVHGDRRRAPTREPAPTAVALSP
jgi:hypothetical protein